jgi:riboflavin transporter FmnP
MAKIVALAILAAISLLGPVLEMVVTGRVEPFSNFDLVETFLSLAPIYWWYYLDKEQRQFRAGPLLNAGVIALTIIALPVYFIRSRGWKRGSLSTAMAAGVLAATFGLGWLGETIGAAIAS